MNIFTEHSIDVPAWKEFDDYDQAIHYVKRQHKAFVSKPSGEADKALSYVSKGPADMVFMLERWKKLGKLKNPFILQERVEGIEMAVGGWLARDGWCGPWCENFEFKKLCNGDLGCATGEQGTVLRYVETSKLASEMLKPLTERLMLMGYTGYIDVNTMIDDSGQPWPLEFTMRLGWPTTMIQEPLHQGDFMSWLRTLCSANSSAPKIKQREVAIGVVMTIPDYPYSHITRKEVLGIPIYGITARVLPHMHPGEMMIAKAPVEKNGSLEEEELWATAGDYVLVMTATGSTVQEASRTAYRRLKTLEVPNSPMYRTDIGQRLKTQLPKLQSHGYARGMSYSTQAHASSR
jgi:phosphoribosylamine--glycine ligase